MSARPAPSRFYGLLTRRVQAARLAAASPHLREEPLLDIGCGLTGIPGEVRLYVGCDRDGGLLALNRERFPEARFFFWDVAEKDAPEEIRSAGPFATILMLALLEHLSHPSVALRRAAPLLRKGGRIVATTPHPTGRVPLAVGAALGLLSTHAAAEHETLLSEGELRTLASEAGLRVVLYRRFLLGLNQLVVLERSSLVS